MRKTLVVCATVLCAVLSPVFAAWQPGLQWGSISGSSMNTTAFPAVTNVSLSIDKAKTTDWPVNTTYVYWGKIYLDGSVYRFGENIDDNARLTINGQEVFNNTSWKMAAFGTVNLPAGWYDFDLRMHNTGSGGGISSSANGGFTSAFGFGYTKGTMDEVGSLSDASTFLVPTDPGDRSFLRYDDGLGFEDLLTIVGHPQNIGTVTPAYGAKTKTPNGSQFDCSADSPLVQEGSTTADKSYTLSPLYTSAFTVTTEGSDENDGSQNAPFATIQKAIDLSVNGGKIFVAAGTYYLDATLNVTNDVEIVGAGRDETILSGANIKDQRGVKMTHANAVLRNLTIADCEAERLLGTGIYMECGELNNVRVTRNHEYISADSTEVKGGAGVYMVDGLITNCFIDANHFTPKYHGTRGAGIRMKGGLVIDSTICSNYVNRTQHNGLGIYMEGGTVRKCKIFENHSTGNSNQSLGHGIYLGNANALVDQCVIYSNNWNGVYIANGTLQNSIVYGHRTTSGDYFSGVYLAKGTVRNNTIYGNVSVNDSNGKSGIHMTGGTAINNIICGNGSAALGSCYITGGTFKTNLIDRMAVNAVDCITGDPWFEDAANCNFKLTNTSPAIDAGTPIAAYDYDFDGVKRPQRKGWDIGAYEIEATTEKLVNIAAKETTIPYGAAITAEAVLDNLDSESVSYEWKIVGGGLSETWSGQGADGIKFVYSSPQAGEYEVSLTVTDSDDISYPAMTTVAFTVKPTNVFVDLRGSNTYPYSSSETAANSLSEAIDAVWQGSGAASTVTIAEGTYYLEKEISLATDIALYGQGRGKTRINGSKIANPLTSMVLLADPNARLRGVTIEGYTNTLNNIALGITMQNGRIEDIEITEIHRQILGGSVGKTKLALDMSGGLATNCFIHSLTAYNDYGTANGYGLTISGGTFVDGVISNIYRPKAEYFGLGINMSGGTIKNTEISDIRSTSAENAWGGGIYMSGDKSVVENIKVRNCVNAVDIRAGTLRNALVVGNSWTYDRTAGIYQTGGIVYNCTAADNRCATDEKNDFQITGGKAINNIAMRALNTKGTFATNLVSVAVTNGVGIIVADPGFKNTRGKNAYHLKSRSPAINAGDNSVWSGVENPVDLDGNPRIYRAESNGVVDLGCFESGPLSGLSIILR